MTRASDTARLLSGGAVINEDSNDVDFRVESNGNANMLIVDGGNDSVGISNSAPPSLLTLGDGTSNITDYDLAAANSGQDAIFINSSDETSASGAKGNSIGFGAVDGHTNRHASICAVQTDSDRDVVGLAFHTHSSSSQSDDMIEAMRIEGNGNVIVGSGTFGADNSASLAAGGTVTIAKASSGGTTHLIIKNGGSTVGSISSNTGQTFYNTTSDYRVKENVVAMTDATARLKQLQPKRFNFKTDKDNTVDGFLAHEVSSIVPEAIFGKKDAVDEDGNIDLQGIDQSKLVPLLVKTVQELEARITSLESK
tara:strand:- start:31 stop:960 length:930 start_codon:yes stop_codon:yes gene_type:complete